MIRVVCMGHVDDEGRKVACGAFLGFKEGAEGISHGLCPNCKAKYEAMYPSLRGKLGVALNA